MDRSERKRKAKNRMLLLIILMLLLCVAAVCFLLLNSAGHEGGSAEEPGDTTTAEEGGELSDEDTDAIESGEAASHVYSHRGSAGDDELTFAAYDKAIEDGSKFIEADMVVSQSGTIYLAHDDYAKDMTGIDGYFSGMTDGQIDELKTKSGSNIVKLKDLFEKYGDSVTYLIDIKYTGPRNIEAFVDAVKESGLQDNIIATGSYFSVLSPLEEEFPDMPKLIICKDQGTFDTAIWKDYIDIVCVPKEIMTSDNRKIAHDHDKLFSAYTLNTKDEIKSAIEMGVDTYFTDDTKLAIKQEKKLRQ